jgi:hypothetical protein
MRDGQGFAENEGCGSGYWLGCPRIITFKIAPLNLIGKKQENILSQRRVLQ